MDSILLMKYEEISSAENGALVLAANARGVTFTQKVGVPTFFPSLPFPLSSPFAFLPLPPCRFPPLPSFPLEVGPVSAGSLALFKSRLSSHVAP